jgi:hypothetical protein
VFSLSDFRAGNEIRILFQDGGYENVTLTRDVLSAAR